MAKTTVTIRLICLFCIFTFIYPPFNYADTFKEGGKDYLSGNFETAAKKFLAASEKGDYRAMYVLGSMYIEGVGVKKTTKRRSSGFQ